jgi:hypothetical protein
MRLLIVARLGPRKAQRELPPELRAQDESDCTVEAYTDAVGPLAEFCAAGGTEHGQMRLAAWKFPARGPGGRTLRPAKEGEIACRPISG